MIRWYAVYTQPHGETKALEHLLRQGYSAYLPRYRARISHARRHQTVLRPLFPRYLFAGIDRASMRWRPILSTVGVADVVRAINDRSGARLALAPEAPAVGASRRVTLRADQPVPLGGLLNVWCISGSAKKGLALINVVATDQSPA